MTGARISTLATLRGSIERIESHSDAYMPGRVALGHADADATLQGGLALGAMHEVFAETGRQSAAATGFVAGLAGRAAARRPLVWVRQDFTEIESGALSMSGLAELGLDPRLLVTVRAADLDAALRTAADALACDALGAVVLEVWGQARQLDLVSSRKLTLAAQASGVTGLLLRMAAEPLPSTAETRWIVRAAHSPPAASSLPAAALMPAATLMPAAAWSAWGAPLFDAQLVRNRHGPVGRWIMEWKCDECLFSKPAAYPQPVAAAPAHRPYQTPALAEQRRQSVFKRKPAPDAIRGGYRFA
jgi:protein ImuA